MCTTACLTSDVLTYFLSMVTLAYLLIMIFALCDSATALNDERIVVSVEGAD